MVYFVFKCIPQGQSIWQESCLREWCNSCCPPNLWTFQNLQSAVDGMFMWKAQYCHKTSTTLLVLVHLQSQYQVAEVVVKHKNHDNVASASWLKSRADIEHYIHIVQYTFCPYVYST